MAPFAIVPIGAKILGLAKGLVGGGKAASGIKAAAGLGKGAIGPMSAGTTAQLAGAGKGAYLKRKAGEMFGALAGLPAKGATQLKNLSAMTPDQKINYLKNLDFKNAGYNMSPDAGIIDRIRRAGTIDGFKANLGQPLTKDTIAGMVVPDLFFGGMAALQTEGDLGDKLIAGTTSAAGGLIGSTGIRGTFGPKSQLGIMAAEWGGGMMGDQMGYGIGQSLIRAKNGGMTPAEQGYAQQDELYRQQLMEELKQQYGL